MNIPIPWFLMPFYERDKAGNHSYMIDGSESWGFGGSNLNKSQNHPILTPAMLFMSKLYSQGRFKVTDTRNGKVVKDHWLISLLDNPNNYQTRMDFLESQQFMQIAQGKAVVYVKRNISRDKVQALYLLNSDLIKWPENLKTPMSHRGRDEKTNNQKIKYDETGENLDIKIADLLFFYDLPNALNKNIYETKSRIDGLNQTLANTQDSLVAKNIILKTNGKELITHKKGGFLLTDEEKQQAEQLFQANYGMSKTRKRGLITKAELSWQSLHIALRDLGLDESVKTDGNIIFTALHIPKDIISLEAKKTTYNNFKESMVSYIQNEMQSTLDASCLVLQKLIEEPYLKITGDFEHLPIMQFIRIERYKGVEQRGKALHSLRTAGIPDEIALEECDWDKTIKLNPLTKQNNEQSGETNTEGTETEGD